MSVVKNLDGFGVTTDSEFGGKGRALDELALLAQDPNLEFEVPEGFLVSTEVYDKFMESSAVDTEWIVDSYDNGISSEELEREVDKMFSEARFPEQYEPEIEEALSNLEWIENDTEMAVRSSAQAEDGEKSWAGRFESEIHLSPTIGDFKEGAKKVYASGWKTDVLDEADDLDDLAGSIGLVAQEMVNAQSGGVIHSREDGKPNTISIAEGPAPWTVVDEDGITYGMIEFDRDISASDIQNQDNLINYKGVESDQPHHSKNQVVQLAGLTETIEDVYDWSEAVEAVDVEFAYDDSEIPKVVQARPYHGDFSEEPEFDLTDVDSDDLICDTEVNQNTGRHYLPAVVVEDAYEGTVSEEPDEYILVAESLPPNLLDQVSWERTQGMIVSQGTPNSHAGTVAGDNDITWLGLMDYDPVSEIETGEEIYIEANNQRGQAFRGDYEWN
jgi:phosphoenolpyruvate synthase/pyruvate phosphate dikinase